MKLPGRAENLRALAVHYAAVVRVRARVEAALLQRFFRQNSAVRTNCGDNLAADTNPFLIPDQ